MVSQNEKGSALLTFIFFFPIIIGCIIFSLYIGERANDQVRVSHVSQLSSDALASHSSQGLNMIAINNQGMAASLQVHNSALIASYYGGVVRALLYGIDDAFKDLTASVQKFSLSYGEQIQKDIFDMFNNYAAFFINNASGLTLYNQKLISFWNYGALSSGVFVANRNSPTSIILPLQGDKEEASMIPYGNFGYKYLETSTAEDAICTTFGTPVKANGYLGMGDLMEFMSGPITALAGGAGVISKMSGVLNSIGGISPIQFTNTECGVALRSPLKNLFNFSNIIGSNTASNIIGKALSIDKIDGFLNEFISFHPGRNGVDPRLVPCGISKNLAKVGLKLKLVEELFSDKRTKGVFEAVSMKEAYDNGVREIRYSEITPEKCNEVEDDPDSRCNKIMHLTSKTHLCPLYFQDVGKHDNFISDLFITKCVSLKSRRWKLPKNVTYSPRTRLREGMNRICAEYTPWTRAAEEGAGNKNGYRLTNVAKQSNYYLADKTNRKDKLVIKRVNGKEEIKHTLGFTYINKLAYPNFLNHQSFKAAIAEPVLNMQESVAIATDSSKCPLIIKGNKEINGKKISKCRVNVGSLLGYEITPNVSSGNNTAKGDDSLTRIMSGGTREVGTESILSRMQWGFSKSRVLFVKGDKDPNPPDFFKTMWPAWNIAPARAKLTDFFVPGSDMYKTVEVFDHLLGK